MPTPPNAFGIANVIIPRGGPKTVPVNLDFDGTDGTILVDASLLVQQAKIEYFQTLYVDNADNPNDLTIETDLVNQRIIVAAGSQGYYSILQPNPPKITFTTTAGAFVVPVQFLNVPVQPMVWGGDSAAFTGLTDAELRATPVPVSTSQPLGGAYTNRSIANLSGASEQLMAANANRRILIISNEGATSIAVNMIGGAASLNTAGSITIAAGGSITLDTYPPTGAINIIGTLNADVTAYEG